LIYSRAVCPGGNGVSEVGSDPPAAETLAPDDRTLEERVRDALPGLTAKRRRLARLFVDEPYTVAFSSADEVAGRTGVDAATVVRFSRALGYDGFTGLKRAIQAEVPQFRTAFDKLRQSLADGRVPQDLYHEVFAQELANVEATAALCDDALLGEAVRIIAGSQTTVVLASGLSAPIGSHLAHLLRVMGFPASQPAVGVAAAAEVSHLDGGCAVVGIALWRYVRSTTQLFAQAKQTGAATIAVTDSKTSSLAANADVTLLAATGAAELSHSLVGPIAIVNALATGLAVVDPPKTLERLAEFDRILRDAEITSD
jgi:DNA-binding MurR/RpiR family transcriptional regulator